jgi:hypothetical protein
MRVVSVSALPAGAVVEIDHGLSGSGSLSHVLGNPASGLCRGVEPGVAGSKRGRVHVVTLEAAPRAGAVVRARLRGIVTVAVGGSLAAGTGLTVRDDEDPSGKRIKGITLGDMEGVEGELSYATVLWDGLVGFTNVFEGDVGGGRPPGGFPPDPPASSTVPGLEFSGGSFLGGVIGEFAEL